MTGERLKLRELRRYLFLLTDFGFGFTQAGDPEAVNLFRIRTGRLSL